jgi:predicted Zn-dependent protease
MNARTVLLSVTALGLLATSCAGGVRIPHLPRNAIEGLEAAETVARVAPDTSHCDKLNADIAVSEEYALGGAVAINWVQRGGGLMMDDEPGRKLHHFVNLVGRNLAAQSPRPTLRWTFGVLEDTQAFDAVSAPGGYVFVTRRLLQGVENEAQLAGVLAHEIAHITGKHALTRYGQVKVNQCKKAAWGKALGEALDLDRNPEALTKLTDGAVDSIVEKGFGKDDEFAADELAVRLMVSAGYDPQEFIRFLGKIPDSRGVFANHPRKVDRVKRLAALLEAAKKPSEGEFPEMPTSTAGYAKPPLPAEFSVVKSSTVQGRL